MLASCEPPSATDPIEVPLMDESDDNIKFIWQLWFGKLQLLDEVLKVKETATLQQTTERISSIVRLADKYQSRGKLLYVGRFLYDE